MGVNLHSGGAVRTGTVLLLSSINPLCDHVQAILHFALSFSTRNICWLVAVVLKLECESESHRLVSPTPRVSDLD